MGAVLRLVEFSNRETQAVLSALHARSVRGEVIGIALCFRAPDGAEQCVYTGAYKADPAQALNASMRMSVQLTQMQDDLL